MCFGPTWKVAFAKPSGSETKGMFSSSGEFNRHYPQCRLNVRITKRGGASSIWFSYKFIKFFIDPWSLFTFFILHANINSVAKAVQKLSCRANPMWNWKLLLVRSRCSGKHKGSSASIKMCSTLGTITYSSSGGAALFQSPPSGWRPFDWAPSPYLGIVSSKKYWWSVRVGQSVWILPVGGIQGVQALKHFKPIQGFKMMSSSDICWGPACMTAVQTPHPPV